MTLNALLIFLLAAQLAFLAYAPWHLSVLALLLYTLRWIDRAEYTGHAAWPRFRAWFRPLGGCDKTGPHLYLVVPCASSSTLLTNIGLANCDLYYALNARYFWIPLLRDVLLWTGAIAQGEDNMLTVLKSDRGICYGMVAREDDDEEALQAQLPQQWLLDMAIREHIKLVVVTVQSGTLYFGTIIQSDVYANAAQLGQTLAAVIRSNVIKALGDKTIKAA